jgi:hypothetical protein
MMDVLMSDQQPPVTIQKKKAPSVGISQLGGVQRVKKVVAEEKV